MFFEAFSPAGRHAQIEDLKAGKRLLSETMDSPANSFFKQIQDGAADSVTDWQGHARRGAVTGTLGFMMAAAADRVAFTKLALPLTVMAVGVTALDNAIFRKDKDQKNDDTFVSNITEFGVDLASASGMGLLMGRVGWGRAGVRHENYIVDTMTDSRYHSARMGGRGPKRIPVRAHYTEHFIPVDAKFDRLTNFLTARDQMHRYEGVANRVVGAHRNFWKDYENHLTKQFGPSADLRIATLPRQPM